MSVLPDVPVDDLAASAEELSVERFEVAQPGLRELPGFGRASQCELGPQDGQHPAVRFIWHHILPQACGGKTTRINLAELCDNCHYAVHAYLWRLAHGGDIPPDADPGQVRLAEQGYEAATAAGTVSKIPHEA